MTGFGFISEGTDSQKYGDQESGEKEGGGKKITGSPLFGEFNKEEDPKKLKAAIQKTDKYPPDEELFSQLNAAEKEQKLEDIIKTQFSEKAKELPNKYANVSIENSGTTYIFKYKNLQQDKEEVNNKKIDKVGKDVEEGKNNLERFEGKFMVESVDTNTGEKRGTETLTIGFKDLVKANTPVEIKNLLQTAIEGQHGGASEKDKKAKDRPKQQVEKRGNVASNKETVIQDIEKLAALKVEKTTILDKNGTLTISFSNGRIFELKPQTQEGLWSVEYSKGKERKQEISRNPVEVIEKEMNPME